MDDALVEAVTEEIDEDEDVAKALYEAHTRLHGMEATWDWSKMFPEGRHYWRVLARGALAVAVPVIREQAATTAEKFTRFPNMPDFTDAPKMIAAAIRQGPSEGEK